MKKAIAAVLVLIGLYLIFAHSAKGQDGKPLGLVDGRFYPCPDSPNCVSTQSGSQESCMEPIPTGNLDAVRVMQAISEIIEESERAKIRVMSHNYIRAEYRSRLLGFIDDVEFYHDDEEGLLHFKSASRIGYSDMGVNRKRMEELSGLIESALKELSGL